MHAVAFRPESFLPARAAVADALPWVPLSEGKAFKPLRFFADDRGFVELLRLDPGQRLGLHRHTGDVYAYNLEGSRRLSSGELIGPGDFVFEPAGNIDWWTVEGDTPLVVMVVVMGAVEYINAEGEVSATYTGSVLLEAYRQYCEAHGLAVVDLVD